MLRSERGTNSTIQNKLSITTTTTATRVFFFLSRWQGWRKAEIAGNYVISGLGVALAVLGGGLSIKKSFF